MKIVNVAINKLKAYENNPRRISDSAIDAVAESIKDFGFKVPCVVSVDNVIITGHTRVKAAEKLGLKEVPCIIADDLTPKQIKAFRLIDNKTSELTGWDFEKLDLELEEIDFDMSNFGFELHEKVDINSFFTRTEADDISDNPEESKVEEKFIICPECGAKISI